MNRNEFAALVGSAVRENIPETRIDMGGLRGVGCAIAASLMLIAVLILPLSILAIELIYAQVKYYPKIVEEINGIRGGETKPTTKSPVAPKSEPALRESKPWAK